MAGGYLNWMSSNPSQCNSSIRMFIERSFLVKITDMMVG